MRIVREGTVIFRGGVIAEINHFEIEDGSQADLYTYVVKHYCFTPEPQPSSEPSPAPVKEPPVTKKASKR